jgi:hypothetical protein
MVENYVYETKKKFRKRDLFLAVLKMSSSMAFNIKKIKNLLFIIEKIVIIQPPPKKIPVGNVCL